MQWFVFSCRYRDLKAEMLILQKRNRIQSGTEDADADGSANKRLLEQLADLASRVKSEQAERHRFEEENEALQREVAKLRNVQTGYSGNGNDANGHLKARLEQVRLASSRASNTSPSIVSEAATIGQPRARCALQVN